MSPNRVGLNEEGKKMKREKEKVIDSDGCSDINGKHSNVIDSDGCSLSCFVVLRKAVLIFQM